MPDGVSRRERAIFEKGTMRLGTLELEEKYRKPLLAVLMAGVFVAILNQTQNLIISAGLLAGSLLCAHLVSQGTFQVGVGVGEITIIPLYRDMKGP